MSGTRALPEQATVVIVGGGVMGASIAFHLAEAGVGGVLLLERGDLAGGSTCKAAGGVRAQFSDAVNIALGARSLLAFEDFAVRPGAEIDLHQVGYLFLHTDPVQAQTAREAVDLQNAMGVPTRLLTAAEAAALNPTVTTSDVLAATFHPRDGHCTPEAVVHGYASAARRLGATVLTGVEVTGVETDGTCITAVQTSEGTVRTSTVVCAAGTWSRAIGDMVGVDLPIHPLRRQILITEPLGPELEQLFPSDMPFTIDAASTLYMHREGPGVLLGMSYQAEQPGFDETYSEDWYPDLVDAIELRCPDLLQVGIAHRWVGLYEVTPDHNALVGRSADVPGFLYAAGFSGHGFLQGPAIGEVIRDLYLDREPVIDVTSLSAERFASGDTLYELGIV
jgi:sarcosine oxidase subunit beta